MALKRRDFLLFLGAGSGLMVLKPLMQSDQPLPMPFQNAPAMAQDLTTGLSFRPIKGPMPLTTEQLATAQQLSDFSQYTLVDDVVLPEGFTYDVIASWGDRIGTADHFGYNNDYLSFVETAPGQGYLTVNHEYISPKPWKQTYQEVIGKSLPFAAIEEALKTAPDEEIDAFALPDGDSLKAQIQEVCKAAHYDLGISVIGIRRTATGQWERNPGSTDRRISGVSGLEDGRYLKATGSAVAVFRKQQGVGYIDGLGDRIIGTFNNCAGGTTPWGTVLSAEENFQDFVPEPVNVDGTSLPPSAKPFAMDDASIDGSGNVFGLAGNKYGWLVEVDPANPNDYGTKHTNLGRFRHEAAAFQAIAGKRLATYSACDRRGGHLYKFVSRDRVTNPQSKTNSRLFANGTLYAAKFNPDGTGQWIALVPDTAVNPDLPSVHVGGMIPLPKRPDGGVVKVTDDAVAQQFKQQFSTLGSLYTGTPEEKQGAILIDAHYAANAAGATCTARPEDTDFGPDGSLFIAFTSGSASSSDGSPHKEVFKGPDGETPYEYGWIMKLMEDGREPDAITFRWEIVATGGEPAAGGLGFANPDNLAFDNNGNLWMVNDMSSEKLNLEIANRTKEDGSAVSQSDLRAIYGNNGIWFLPTSGANAGETFLFGYGPMECEMTGPYFTNDQQTLFLSAQHPGEVNGRRQEMAIATRRLAMKTTDGQDFTQTREVPVGSNWPTKQANDPPKPSVIAIRRSAGGSLLAE